MKRLITLLATIVFAGQTWARTTTFEIGNLKYTVTDETNHYVSVVNGSTEPTDTLEIPSQVTYPETDGTIYTVASIGSYAFKDCSGLTTVTIPNSVTSIGWYAFEECNGLTSLIFAEGSQLTNIGDLAFCGCNNLKSIAIPNSVTSIGDYAFEFCSGLTSLIFAEGSQLTFIGNLAFYGCSGLTSVTIPNTVTNIGSEPFYDCSGLTVVNVESGNTVYTSENGVLFNKAKTNLICYPAGKTETTYIIPNTVTSISTSAFYNCSSLTSVTIPDSVTSIGDFAFFGCSGLLSVTISKNVEKIGCDAFSECTATINCEVDSKPNGWANDWLGNEEYKGKVVWGYKPTENQGGNEQGGENPGGNENNPSTPVTEFAANAVNIYTYGRNIVVENAAEEIRVYDVMGRLIVETPHCDVSTEIRLNGIGVYIVKVGNIAKRVVIN
ncbi:MAG: leucine-rich repeat domain-containing protein [Salinivirgaceae bacterium]|nr:leucine-rich repeat domain-containing protein [Salinivirgaceae bacterium]